MFGYIRPLKGELKVKEYESFRSVYCGLCHVLKKRCGFAARFVVNYDFTFMAMLLADGKEPCAEYKRCPASPGRKKRCYCSGMDLDVPADYSVILAYWKLKDTAADEGFFKAMGAGIASLLLRRAYVKAAKNAVEFDKCVRDNLALLAELEEQKCPSIDMTADKFAKLLEAVASGVEDKNRRRVLELLFYHTGRIIYLLDAVDDLSGDIENNKYNPLKYRFNLENDAMSEADKNDLQLSIRHSQNQIISAFQLLETGYWNDILTNIIYLGLPTVTHLVFTGEWREMQKISRNGLDK